MNNRCMENLKSFLIIPLLLPTLVACAKEQVINTQVKEAPGPIVIDLAKTATLADTIAQNTHARVIYVGETHTAYEDHLMQLETLKAMHAQPGNLAVGVEWFQWPFQEHLDAYLNGHISEKEMLANTGYFDRWAFDYRLYRPIIEYAKSNNIPVIALNAPKELTDAISSEGLDSIPDHLKEQLPDNYDLSDKAYHERLEAVFKMHPDRGNDFESFLNVQLTWDETMAQKTADYLAADPANRIIVFAGGGHIEYRSGIPNRVARRTGAAGKTFMIPKGSVTDPAVADYLLHVAPQTLPESGIFGAYLDTKNDQVVITAFSETSTGKKAGMQKDDRIVSIDGNPITSYAELKLVMLNKKPGDEIDVVLERKSASGELEQVRLRVELGSREKPSPHGHGR